MSDAVYNYVEPSEETRRAVIDAIATFVREGDFELRADLSARYLIIPLITNNVFPSLWKARFDREVGRFIGAESFSYEVEEDVYEVIRFTF